MVTRKICLPLFRWFVDAGESFPNAHAHPTSALTFHDIQSQVDEDDDDDDNNLKLSHWHVCQETAKLF